MTDRSQDKVDTEYPDRIDQHKDGAGTDLPSDSELEETQHDLEIERDEALEDTFPASDPIPPKSIK